MDGIHWISDEDQFPFGYWVAFARDVSSRDMLVRLGVADPSDSLLTRMEANELADESDGVAVRAGHADGWGYAMAEGGPVRANGPEALSLLSAGTEAVEVFCTANSDMMFGYARSGTVLCRFEPGREYEREGADPDLLVPAMERAGLAVSRPDGPEAEAADAARAPETEVLSLLETHFGISLSSREVREGKLLCAVRPA